MSDVLTHLQLSERFANPRSGPPRPQWQHEANARFFEGIWTMLRMGGQYHWPGVNITLIKVEGGWKVLQ